MVGRWFFFGGMAYFQVRTVSFREGKFPLLQRQAAATKHLPPSPSTRGAELRALRRPAQRLTEPRVQQRPRRPKVNDSYGFGYLPGHPEMEDVKKTEDFQVRRETTLVPDFLSWCSWFWGEGELFFFGGGGKLEPHTDGSGFFFVFWGGRDGLFLSIFFPGLGFWKHWSEVRV